MLIINPVSSEAGGCERVPRVLPATPGRCKVPEILGFEMIFNWLKQRKQERLEREFGEFLSPIIGPVSLLRAYGELGSEYWAEINAGRKKHPITTRQDSNVIDLWNDALIEGMGYLVKYSAPDPTVFVDIRHQVATMTAIIRRHQSGAYKERFLPEPAAGVWPVYDWLRTTARQAGEITFGGMDGEAVYADMVRGIAAELPKWSAGPPPIGSMPRTALEVIADDVEAKTKLLALTIQMGPDYLGTKKAMSDTLPLNDPGRRAFDEMFSTIMVAKNPDDYHTRRAARR